jgi:hypothetical protein
VETLVSSGFFRGVSSRRRGRGCQQMPPVCSLCRDLVQGLVQVNWVPQACGGAHAAALPWVPVALVRWGPLGPAPKGSDGRASRALRDESLANGEHPRVGVDVHR